MEAVEHLQGAQQVPRPTGDALGSDDIVISILVNPAPVEESKVLYAVSNMVLKLCMVCRSLKTTPCLHGWYHTPQLWHLDSRLGMMVSLLGTG